MLRQGLGPFSPWAEGAADLLGEALAVGLAEEGVPMDGSGVMLGVESDCGATEAGLAGVRPLCSKLPPDWGAAQQLQAVQDAWQDLLHAEQQLATVYSGFTDQQWADAVEGNLLSGDAFRACSL